MKLIEVENEVHSFIGEDSSHPGTKMIYVELKKLTKEMRSAGYSPHIQLVMHDVDDHRKDYAVIHHSEKLASASGFIKTPHRIPLYIYKNVRMCTGSHTTTKLISKIAAREIKLQGMDVAFITSRLVPVLIVLIVDSGTVKLMSFHRVPTVLLSQAAVVTSQGFLCYKKQLELLNGTAANTGLVSRWCFISDQLSLRNIITKNNIMFYLLLGVINANLPMRSCQIC